LAKDMNGESLAQKFRRIAESLLEQAMATPVSLT